MCTFIEAVVDGYSPIDKHLCRLARAGALLRSLPWWNDMSWVTDRGPRGSVYYSRKLARKRREADVVEGETPWR